MLPPGKSSGFRARFRLDSNREAVKVLRPASDGGSPN